MEIAATPMRRWTEVQVSVSDAPVYQGPYRTRPILPDSVQITYYDYPPDSGLREEAQHQVSVMISGQQVKKDGSASAVRSDHRASGQELPQWVQALVEQYRPVVTWERAS